MITLLQMDTRDALSPAHRVVYRGVLEARQSAPASLEAQSADVEDDFLLRPSASRTVGRRRSRCRPDVVVVVVDGGGAVDARRVDVVDRRQIPDVRLD